MKFDVVVGNPPYQAETDGNSRPIWDKFINKSISLLKEAGYLCAVHPAGWRNVDGRFTDTRDLLLSKQMEYLEIHNEKDGLDTFGANTRYDWYVVKNTDRTSHITKILFEDRSFKEIDLKGLSFIPNHSYNKISSLIAKENEDRVEIIANSAYHHTREHVQSNRSDEFKYPVVYHVSKSTGPNLHWSSRNDMGHFGVPKIIWGNSARTGFYLDIDGSYGLTQFAYGLVDTPDNLEKIIKVLDDHYDEIASMTNVVGSGINNKVLATFRKDFWKEFV